ncbi:MAG: hypothetical protein EA397_12720 [Deltaproteobacteria bacterium]|nr:MAG: hypothetical protein EA397_12720 [Deltaproteobacteria bacterium]
MTMTRRELLIAGGCLGAASLLWGGLAAPAMAGSLDEQRWIEGLAEARLWPWEGGPRDELQRIHRANPEYDLMSRTFLAMALGDLGLTAPDRWRARAIAALDAILGDTLSTLEREGPAAFSMSYWRIGKTATGRSLFVDGELLLMLGVRRLLEDRPDRRRQAEALAGHVVRAMTQSPLLCAESYPEECWTFCNTLALAALRLHDRLGRTDHAPLARRWVRSARTHLLHPQTGSLLSSFQPDGTPKDGPEGSTLWLTTHALRLVDPDFAASQYALARRHLGRIVAGFGWAREWPAGHEGPLDVDSGLVVPGLEASPSSSGLAILAARSFGDQTFTAALLASLSLAASPVFEDGRLRFAASNAVGDSVILAGLTAGPLWRTLGAEEA